MSEMSHIVTVVKSHKLVIGFGVLAAIVVLYAISKGSSLASSGTASNGESALDLQYQQVAAAAGVQQAQVQGAVDVAQINADTTNAQTAAQLAVAEDTIQSNEVINANNVAGNIATTQITANSSDYQAGLQAETTQAAISAEAGVAQSEIGATTTLAENAQNLESSVLQSTLKTGRSSTGITQILSGLFGQGPASIAANQPSQVASTNATSPVGILSSIGKIFGGLFGG